MTPTRRSTLAAGLVLALASLGARAQGSTPPPGRTAPAASATAPSASTVGPRLRSPVETGNRATAPGDLQPERPISPQISIPLGKKPAAPSKGEERVVRRGNAPATGGVDDAAARCEAQTDEQMRAACRAQLAREAKGKLPN